MNKDTENKAQNLLATLKDKSIDATVQDAQMVSQVDALRTEIFEFFKERMKRIKSSETLKEKAQDALEAELDRGELSFNQIMTIFTTASRESRSAAEAIIGLFKPVPGANSILADSLGTANKQDDYEEMFESMSQDELRKIDGLHNMLKEISKRSTGEFHPENTEDDK